MKKIISFSLWGSNSKYTIGAIRNAELALKIYPSWVCRFYCGMSVPSQILESLRGYENTEVIEMPEEGNWEGMFWRFLACEDSDIMLSRDTDSRLSFREKISVDEWLESNKNFHIIRDHPYHNAKILGGMWGCRNGILKNIRNLISEYKKGDYWQVDQEFLRDVIYQKIKNDVFVHDEFFNIEPFSNKIPSIRENYEFIGDVFDENDNRHPEYWKNLVKK